MSTSNAAAKIIPPPQAKRLRAADLPAVADRGVQLVGVDAPPGTLAKAAKTLGIVELPTPPVGTPSFADLVADAVVAKLTAARVVVPPPMTTAEPERVFIDAAEAAAILGISRAAFDKRVQRRQVPGVVRTAGRRIQIDKAKMLAGLAKRGR
jgi:predicted DNA-binding transcriptional regulator AlpA